MIVKSETIAIIEWLLFEFLTGNRTKRSSRMFRLLNLSLDLHSFSYFNSTFINLYELSFSAIHWLIIPHTMFSYFAQSAALHWHFMITRQPISENIMSWLLLTHITNNPCIKDVYCRSWISSISSYWIHCHDEKTVTVIFRKWFH